LEELRDGAVGVGKEEKNGRWRPNRCEIASRASEATEGNGILF
jgi:hypothetical protein